MTIGLVPPPGLNVPSYQIPENSGPIEICVEVTAGTVIQGQTVTVTFSTSDGSAQRKLYSVSHRDHVILLTNVSFARKGSNHHAEL